MTTCSSFYIVISPFYTIFFPLLDSMFLNIEPEQVIPSLLPANLNHTFDLLDNVGGATTKLISMFVSFKSCTIILAFHLFTISTRGHKASTEEAFIITITKLAAGRTSESLMDVFGDTGRSKIDPTHQNQEGSPYQLHVL